MEVFPMRYRRAKAGGGTYFFAVNLADRNSTLLIDKVDVLRQAIGYVRQRHPFQIDAMVILPDHLHALWTLPKEDFNFPTRWMLIKSTFSRAIAVGEGRGMSRVRKGERGIWQRRYWEHLIRDEQDYSAHVDYIHWNPVKHGYVNEAIQWPYSSFHRYVRKGILPAIWAGTDEERKGWGE
jgi:putative transposase